MTSQMRTAGANRRGFSLLELLLVIGIITLLVSLGFVAFGNAFTSARDKATRGTIRKIHGLMQDRTNAFSRWMENENDARQKSMYNSMPALLQFRGFPVVPNKSDKAVYRILVRKELFRQEFPQRFEDLFGPDGQAGNGGGTDLTRLGEAGSDDPPLAVSIRKNLTDVSKHQRDTESAALLYAMINFGSIVGQEGSDVSSFTTQEYKDTDGDGLMEYVDAWEKPIQFYRWPTRLIRPDGIQTSGGTRGQVNPIQAAQVSMAELTMSNLPTGRISSTKSAMDQDPEDQVGEVFLRLIGTSDLDAQLSRAQLYETYYHTYNTYHQFLIISAGPDGMVRGSFQDALGLYLPYDTANKGELAQPLPGTNAGDHGLNDSITNRQGL